MVKISNLFKAPSPVDPLDVQLKDAMFKMGIDPPSDIILNGALHRFDSGGKEKTFKKETPGWYVAFSDGIPAGAFGCWRRDIQGVWRADIGRPLTPFEVKAQDIRIAEAKVLRDEARALAGEEASVKAREIWENAQAASEDHPYLKRKGIQPHGARIASDGRLIVPLMDSDNDLSSIQYISPDGEKRYFKGGFTKGRFWMLPIDVDYSSGPVYIAEGYATAATIMEQTRRPCIVAYSASNLPAVAEIIREILDGPNQDLVIVADNDPTGVGQKYADQAAAKYGCRVVSMPDSGDANDYYQSGGDLAALLNPAEIDDRWMDEADDLCSQPAPVCWLIRGWLEENALIMVHGPSGGGKTFLILDWCLHMAAGIDQWAGCRVKPYQVAYLAGEGHHGLRSRIAGWKAYHGYSGHLKMQVSQTGVKLNTKEGYDFAVSHLRRMPEPPALIVIDTLHKFWNGDENKSNDAGLMIDACESLKREFNCSVLLVHHTGVSEERQHRARGSSAWQAALEIEISVIPDKVKGTFKIIQMKTKNSENLAPLECKLTPSDVPGWFDEDDLQVVTKVVNVIGEVDETPLIEDEKLSKFLTYFKNAFYAGGSQVIDKSPYVSRNDLKQAVLDALKCSDRTADNHLKPSEKKKVVGYLLEKEAIQEEEEGWIIVESGVKASIMMRLNNDKK